MVGRPNAGKSTLVNTLVGRKVAIVSPKPQTTRNRIQGILNREDSQIVLIDTPGIHKPGNILSRQMMDELQHAIEGIDVLSLIVDASAGIGPGDHFSIEWIRRFHGPVFLLLNKIDRIKKQHPLPLIDRYNREIRIFRNFPDCRASTVEGCLICSKAGSPFCRRLRLTSRPISSPISPNDSLPPKLFARRPSSLTREEVPTPSPCSGRQF